MSTPIHPLRWPAERAAYSLRTQQLLLSVIRAAAVAMLIVSVISLTYWWAIFGLLLLVGSHGMYRAMTTFRLRPVHAAIEAQLAARQSALEILLPDTARRALAERIMTTSFWGMRAFIPDDPFAIVAHSPDGDSVEEVMDLIASATSCSLSYEEAEALLEMTFGGAVDALARKLA